MSRVELPPGCTGLDMADGTRYSGKPGTSVEVDDRHARAVNASQHRSAGVLSATRYARIGTRTGRRCPACHFAAQAWTQTCPRCGTDTIEEQL